MADDWQERAKEIKQERIRKNHDDLNNEVGGRDVGRIKRFVAPEHIGGEATETNNDTAFMDMAFQLLTIEQQKQYERLQHQFELYDQAIELALVEIDEEIALAHQDLERIQDNATVLNDDSHVYRDEENGHFYDENDKRLSEEDELEALSKYNPSQSKRHDWKKGKEKFASLEDERKDTVEFAVKKNELEQRAKDNPQDAAKIQDKLTQSPAPDRVQKKHAQLADKKEVTTSFAKEQFGDSGIDAELSAMPAFHHAGGFEQVPAEPVQKPEPDKISPQSNPGMSLG